MSTPVLVPGRVSIARLHGEACWHCGAVTRWLAPAGKVVLAGLGRVWSIVSCGCTPTTGLESTMPPSTDAVPLPDPMSLSDAQQRGAHCVWCAVALAAGGTHDLGPRPVFVHGTSALWFPRCCRSCWEGHQ